jgi:hypothetical protein
VRIVDDFRTHFETKRGFWIEERSSIPCILPKDGQLAIFRRSEAEEVLNKNYPYRDYNGGEDRIWFFNATRDREIANTEGLSDGRVYCNPQVLWEHFLKKDS